MIIPPPTPSSPAMKPETKPMSKKVAINIINRKSMFFFVILML